MSSELDEFERDMFREIGNMGASYSANSLSEIMNKKVEIKVPDFDILPLEEFPRVVGGGEEIVAGILVKFQGDISGYLMMFYQFEHALNLADLLLGKEIGTTKELDEMDISAIQEVGNIMASSFANAIADFTKLKITPTPPAFTIDMAESLLNYLIVELGQTTEKAIFFYTDFIIPPNEILGHLFLSPNEESLKVIFSKVKEVYGGMI